MSGDSEVLELLDSFSHLRLLQVAPVIADSGSAVMVCLRTYLRDAEAEGTKPLPA